MKNVFVSKSGAGDREIVRALADELAGTLEVLTEDDFRNRGRILDPHADWIRQFDYTRTASLHVVLLTGSERDETAEPNISVGQNIEVFDALGRGIPVVWCGASQEGNRIASKWQSILTRNHPCKISHQVDAVGPRDSFIPSLAELCVNLANVPIPTLPEQFSPGTVEHIQYHVCETTHRGWRFRNLSERDFDPVLRVRFRDHIISSPYQPLIQGEYELIDIPLSVTDPAIGLIEGDIQLEHEGVGQLHLLWKPRSDVWYKTEIWPLGAELLHWDFCCGNYPRF
ncbi:MAG: hypothetical protein IPM66_21815 [Acidobacteriota bacterium]|nr:MAG: hypothetical protein IPM66_21815 [Acidobacteriota bacterium]